MDAVQAACVRLPVSDRGLLPVSDRGFGTGPGRVRLRGAAGSAGIGPPSAGVLCPGLQRERLLGKNGRLLAARFTLSSRRLGWQPRTYLGMARRLPLPRGLSAPSLSDRHTAGRSATGAMMSMIGTVILCRLPGL
jgi:hypothetical protein